MCGILRIDSLISVVAVHKRNITSPMRIIRHRSRKNAFVKEIFSVVWKLIWPCLYSDFFASHFHKIPINFKHFIWNMFGSEMWQMDFPLLMIYNSNWLSEQLTACLKMKFNRKRVKWHLRSELGKKWKMNANDVQLKKKQKNKATDFPLERFETKAVWFTPRELLVDCYCLTPLEILVVALA